MNREGPYLSFDVATRSLAWALLRIRRPRPEDLAAVSAALDGGAEPGAACAPLRGCFRLLAGGAADLTGKRDKDVHTPERVDALVGYLRGTVLPALAAGGVAVGPGLKVAVEYQMGANSNARVVAAAILATFHGATTFFVGPSLKNGIRVPGRGDLDHCMFVERYARPYDANKAHAKALYWDAIAPAFGHRVGDTEVPRAMRKDFADAVLQALGFYLSGETLERARDKF